MTDYLTARDATHNHAIYVSSLSEVSRAIGQLDCLSYNGSSDRAILAIAALGGTVARELVHE